MGVKPLVSEPDYITSSSSEAAISAAHMTSVKNTLAHLHQTCCEWSNTGIESQHKEQNQELGLTEQVRVYGGKNCLPVREDDLC